MKEISNEGNIQYPDLFANDESSTPVVFTDEKQTSADMRVIEQI